MAPVLDPGSGSLLLIVLIILAFVVAFKVMEMVFQTLMVAVMSAVFYLSLVYLFNYSFSMERVLLFAFLGMSLYMLYSFLATAYWLGSTLVAIPYRILKAILQPVKGLYLYLRKKYRMRRLEKGQGDEPGDDRDVKDVVLDKVEDD